MNTKKKLLLSTLAALVLGLTGCQSSMTVTTDNNQSVVVPKSPSKVVVMNYGALDTLDALGKGSIVAGAPLSVLPSYLEQYKNTTIADTGNMKEPSIDAIKQAKPQLIIIDGRQASRAQELSKIAPVINLSVDAKNYLESTKKHINVLADITGTEKTASNLIQALDVKITHAQTVAQASSKKAIINASSSAALIHDVLKVKRAVPFFIQPINNGERPKPTFIDNNYVNNVKPDIIYVVDRSKAIGQAAMKEDFFDAKVLAENKTQVVYLTPDLWYLSGGGAESLDRQIDEVINGLK